MGKAVNNGDADLITVDGEVKVKVGRVLYIHGRGLLQG